MPNISLGFCVHQKEGFLHIGVPGLGSFSGGGDSVLTNQDVHTGHPFQL